MRRPRPAPRQSNDGVVPLEIDSWLVLPALGLLAWARDRLGARHGAFTVDDAQSIRPTHNPLAARSTGCLDLGLRGTALIAARQGRIPARGDGDGCAAPAVRRCAYRRYNGDGPSEISNS
jgi:hypothetical protein